jgi:indole-3-glycerol phosphate synthase
MSVSSGFLARLQERRELGQGSLIAELKVRSGSGEELLRGRDVASVARGYEAAGAACLSVVTGRWFGGTLELLTAVAQATSLPILQKDFLVSRDSLARAAALGASAVLLTRKLLTKSSLLSLTEYAVGLALTPFIEVCSLEELAGSSLGEHVVLAVNNRDIIARETGGDGIARGLALCETAKRANAGALVSSSGIESLADAQRLIAAGFDGLLVGSALLRATDPGDRARDFCTAIASARAKDSALAPVQGLALAP